MARYRGPRSRISRKFGEGIFGPSKELKKKPHPPGQHGKSRRRKQSEYAVQLQEKQKAKYLYGVLEKQFRNLYLKASSKAGVTGTILLQYLEARLDNTVYRLGLAPTRRAARQLVSHKHITVNGQVTNIASYSCRPGDLIGIREKSLEHGALKDFLGTKPPSRFNWLEWDNSQKVGKFVNYPEREEIPENLKEQLIIELYSK